MRRSFIILVILGVMTHDCMASEVILGQVQSIDWQNGLMVVLSETQDNTAISIQFDPNQMKEKISVGKWIRILGDYYQDRSSNFQAKQINHITGPIILPYAKTNDLSGVRKRIKQMHKRMHHKCMHHKRMHKSMPRHIRPGGRR